MNCIQFQPGLSMTAFPENSISEMKELFTG